MRKKGPIRKKINPKDFFDTQLKKCLGKLNPSLNKYLGQHHVTLDDICSLFGSFGVRDHGVLRIHSGRTPMAENQRTAAG